MTGGQDLLAQLKDVHNPDPIGLWPWAPGWYLMTVLALLALFYTTYVVLRRYRRGHARRYALKELERLESRYQESEDAVPELAMQVGVLLKQVALSYYPRPEVAGLEGEAWLAFLDAHAKKTDFVRQGQLLIHAPYQAHCEQSLHPLFTQARAWISERGR